MVSECKIALHSLTLTKKNASTTRLKSVRVMFLQIEGKLINGNKKNAFASST